MSYRPNNRMPARAQRAASRPAIAARRVPGHGGSWLLTAAGWVLFWTSTVAWNAFTPIAERQGEGAYGSNALARTIKLLLLASGLIVAFRQWPALRALFRKLNPFFIAFLALVPASYLWSISPGDTMARFVSVMTIVSVWAAVCVGSWTPHRFQDLTRPILTLIVVGSIIYTMTSPELAIETGEGTLKDAWRGLTSQKNTLGQLASFATLFWLHGWLTRETRAWKAILFGGAAAACLLYSRSSTSLLASAFVAVFLLMLLKTPGSWRRAMPYLIAGFAALVLTYALAVLKLVPGLELLLEPITAFTGKDLTFSNRSLIWDIIKEHIAYSPYLGSGYGAYWIGPVTTSPSYTFLQRMYFYPNEAHNGYLEIVNDLGFLGLILMFGYFIVYLRQALQLLRVDRNQSALYLAVFFQQTIINLSESCWLDVNSGLSFVVTTFATLALARSALDQRAAQTASHGQSPIGRGQRPGGAMRNPWARRPYARAEAADGAAPIP